MQAARSTIAAVAVTAAATLMMLAKPPGIEAAQAADPLRERAEDLARAASQRFGEVLKGEPQGVERPRPAGPGEEAWGPGKWLQRSTRDYNSVMRRLSQASGSGPTPTTPTPSAPPAKAHPQGAGASSNWLAWSSERFQEIMRKLAEGAAPPGARQPKAARKASSEDTTGQAKTQPEKQPDAVAKGEPAAPPASPALPKPPRTPGASGEERKIAETRRAEAAKREAEVKRTEDVLKAEQQRKAAEAKAQEVAKKPDAARGAAEVKGDEDARRAEAARKATEAKKAEDDRKAADAAKKAEAARRLAEAKAAEDARRAEAARKAVEAKKADDDRKAATARQDAEARAAKKAALAEQEKKAHEDRKAEREKRAAAAKKVAEEARQRGAEAKRLADQKAKDTARQSAEKEAAQIAKPKEPGSLGPIAQGPPQERSKGAGDKGGKAAERGSETGAPKTGVDGKALTTGRSTRAERNRVRIAAQSRSCETAGTAIELPGWYVVKKGDTLWSIAERHYGAGRRYKRIYAANRRRIRSAHWIEPCQRVYLPRPPQHN